jgi:hypothetical protein
VRRLLHSAMGEVGVRRGANLRVTDTLGWDGRISICPEWRSISAGVAALVVAFAFAVQGLPRAVSVFETLRPKNFEPWASHKSPDNRRLHAASLETKTAFTPADSFDERFIDSFDSRFAGAVDWPDSRQTAEVNEPADSTPLLSPDRGGPAVAGPVVGPTARGVKTPAISSAASAPKKQLRVADAEGSNAPSDADSHTAIYDIAAHMVYLPNGQRLEAHSGLGGHLDDPRYVSEKDRGPTPPNMYELSLRERLFHGVRAIRLTPVGGGNMYGRDGILAHTYMLGPNGQSNGCVSFRDYSAFLNAYLNGDINRLVVVERLAGTPTPKTALGGIGDAIKAFFGRS